MSKKNRDRKSSRRALSAAQSAMPMAARSTPTDLSLLPAETGDEQTDVSIAHQGRAIPKSQSAQDRASARWRWLRSWKFWLVVYLLLAPVASYWWLLERYYDPVIIMNDKFEEVVRHHFFQAEQRRLATCRAQLSKPERELEQQLQAIADSVFVWLRAGDQPEATQRIAAYLEQRFQVPASVMRSSNPELLPARRTINDWLQSLKEKIVQPLTDDQVRSEVVRYRGSSYPLTTDGAARLNQALRNTGSRCRLELDEESGRFLFGAGRFNEQADIWSCSDELVASPVDFPTGWTDPFTNHIVLREADVRQSIVHLATWTQLQHVWVPSRMRRSQQSLTRLWEILLGQYGLAPTISLDTLVQTDGYRAMAADWAELTLAHELGHRAAMHDTGDLQALYRQYDDNALAGFVESVAELAPMGPVQLVVDQARMQATRPVAIRKFYLLLTLGELKRFTLDQKFVLSEPSSGRCTYHTMIEHTSLVLLSSLNDPTTINWPRLAERRAAAYELLRRELVSRVPTTCLRAVGSHGTVIDPSHEAEALTALRATTQASGGSSYLDMVIARALTWHQAVLAGTMQPEEVVRLPYSNDYRETARTTEVLKLVVFANLLNTGLDLERDAVKIWTYGGIPVHSSIYRALDRLRAEQFVDAK